MTHDTMSSKKGFVIGQKGVSYGLQPAPAKKPAQRKPSMFGNDDDDDDLANDRNAVIRAQQGVKRGDAKVCAHGHLPSCTPSWASDQQSTTETIHLVHIAFLRPGRDAPSEGGAWHACR